MSFTPNLIHFGLGTRRREDELWMRREKKWKEMKPKERQRQTKKCWYEPNDVRWHKQEMHVMTTAPLSLSLTQTRTHTNTFLSFIRWRVPNYHFIMTSKVIYFDSVCHMQCFSLSPSYVATYINNSPAIPIYKTLLTCCSEKKTQNSVDLDLILICLHLNFRYRCNKKDSSTLVWVRSNLSTQKIVTCQISKRN